MVYSLRASEWPQLQTHILERDLSDSLGELPVATVMRETIEAMHEVAIQRGEVRPDIDLEVVSRVVNVLTIVVSDSQMLPYLNQCFQITDDTVPLIHMVDVPIDLVMDGIAK